MTGNTKNTEDLKDIIAQLSDLINNWYGTIEEKKMLLQSRRLLWEVDFPEMIEK